MALTRADIVDKFKTWRANSARVQVDWEGLGGANQRLLTARLDGIVHVVEPDGERTLVLVGGDNNTIHMYLTEGCTFQSMTFGASEPAIIADVDSMTAIQFSTGETCIVTFYRPLN